MARFGDTWRAQAPDFWDKMWERHRRSSMTQRLLEIAMQSDAMLEIGAGAGHFVWALRARGYEGLYLGVEVAAAAVAEANRRLAGGDAGPTFFLEGDFTDRQSMPKEPPEEWGLRMMLALEAKRVRENDADDPVPGMIVVARKVLQHQAHWAPMVITGLRIAPVFYAGIGYVEGRALHSPVLVKTGSYNTELSLSRMLTEADAMGLETEVTPFTDAGRPPEAIVAFSWAPGGRAD
jgi:hypothetical protein